VQNFQLKHITTELLLSMFVPVICCGQVLGCYVLPMPIKAYSTVTVQLELLSQAVNEENCSVKL